MIGGEHGKNYVYINRQYNAYVKDQIDLSERRKFPDVPMSLRTLRDAVNSCNFFIISY